MERRSGGRVEVAELLAGLDGNITESERTISDLQAWLAAEQQTLVDRRREAATVRSAVLRVNGGAPAPAEPADPSWRSLSNVGAVERALSEAGPLHLHEIVDVLVAKGRKRMTTASVSASLTHLSQTRSSVVNVGKGRWDYVPRPAPRLVGSEKLPSQEIPAPDPAIPVSTTGSPIA